MMSYISLNISNGGVHAFSRSLILDTFLIKIAFPFCIFNLLTPEFLQ